MGTGDEQIRVNRILDQRRVEGQIYNGVLAESEQGSFEDGFGR